MYGELGISLPQRYVGCIVRVRLFVNYSKMIDFSALKNYNFPKPILYGSIIATIVGGACILK